MESFYTGAIALTITMLLAATAMAGGRLDGSYLHELDTEYVTPHLSWAKPLSDGPIRAMFVTPRRMAAREVIELYQRLDLEFEAVTTPHRGAIHRDDVYEASVSGTTFTEKKAELIEKLQQSHDVIVLGNFFLDALPNEAQYRVVRHVADGGGLVLTYQRHIPYRQLFNEPVDDAAQMVGGIEMGGLFEPLREMTGEELVETYRFGEGRIVKFNYPQMHGALYGGVALTENEPYSTRWKARYENNMALMARAVRWAAAREPAVRLTGTSFDETAAIPARALSEDGLTFTLAGDALDGLDGLRLKGRLRDRWNNIVWSGERPVTTEGDTAAVTLTPGAMPAGEHFVDWIVASERGVEDFGYQLLEVTHAGAPPTLQTQRESYEKGEPIAGRLQAEPGWQDGATVRLELVDLPYGYIWWRRDFSGLRAEVDEDDAFSFTIEPPALPTLAGVLRAEVRYGDEVVLREQKTLFFPQRELEPFPKFIWNAIPEHLPEMFAAQVVDRDGWRGGLTHPVGGERARTSAMLDMRFIPYMTRIGIGAGDDGRTELRYWLGISDDEVEQALEGDDSLYNPVVREMWRKNIEQRIENLPQYGPMIYNLGDENNFSYDAGFAPSDEEGFREHLRERYGSIDRLNREWGTDYADFDALERMTPEEIRESQNFPARLEQRRYMERQYAETHHLLADYIRSMDPHAVVGAEGSQPGDLEYTIDGLDFWGPYSDLVGDELLRSIGPEKIRTLWWGGYTGSHGGRDTYPFPLWRPLLQGVINGNSWYSGSVGSEGFLGADLRLAEYYKQLRQWLLPLEEGLAPLLVEQPLKEDGIAILWSHASFSASFMDERFFSPRDAVQALLNFSYRYGLNVDFLTTSMVEADELADYRVLFLPGATALSEREVERIEAFVERGGVVIADLNPGVLNAYCRPLERSALAELFGASSLSWDVSLEMDAVRIDTEVRGRPIRFEAERAWQSPEAETFRVRTAGDGVAILLNFNLGSAQNTGADTATFDRWLLDLLALADVRPRVEVEGIERDDLLLRLREQGDCLTIGLLTDRDAVGRTAELTLPGSRHIYEADGSYLGEHERLSVTLDAPFMVLCAFPERVAPPVLALSRDRLEPGEAASVDIEALSTDALYRLELRTPEGELLRRRTTLIVPGRWNDPVDIRFAVNDAAGEYRVTIVDVRTGLRAEAGVTLTEAASP